MEQQIAFFLASILGLLFGALVVWRVMRADTNSAYARAKSETAGEVSKLEERLSGKESRIDELMRDREQLKSQIEKRAKENAELQAARVELETLVAEKDRIAREKLAAVDEAQEQLVNTFRALSAEALQGNNKAFLDMARVTLDQFQAGARNDLESRQQAIGALIDPLRESLGKVDSSVKDILKSHAGVHEQVKLLYDAQNVLRTETANLVHALRTPAVRGRWGELQLRRVVEMAGMEAHCDFDEQTSIETDEGRLRPDLIVHLPARRQLAIDAKVSLKAYLEAMEATDDQTRAAKLAEHASQVRAHVQRLGSKSYWDGLPSTPEFVVAFLPGEAFFSAALESDPDLIEFGIEHRVILSTPTTLIALLKAVAYGWRQEKLAANAQEISTLGKMLYQRLSTFTQHMESVRTNLQRTVEGYNRAVGSLESRVLVSARRFHELGAAGESELPSLDPVDNFPRSLRAVELAVSGGEPQVVTEEPEPEPIDLDLVSPRLETEPAAVDEEFEPAGAQADKPVAELPFIEWTVEGPADDAPTLEDAIPETVADEAPAEAEETPRIEVAEETAPVEDVEEPSPVGVAEELLPIEEAQEFSPAGEAEPWAIEEAEEPTVADEAEDLPPVVIADAEAEAFMSFEPVEDLEPVDEPMPVDELVPGESSSKRRRPITSRKRLSQRPMSRRPWMMTTIRRRSRAVTVARVPCHRLRR